MGLTVYKAVVSRQERFFSGQKVVIETLECRHKVTVDGRKQKPGKHRRECVACTAKAQSKADEGQGEIIAYERAYAEAMGEPLP